MESVSDSTSSSTSNLKRTRERQGGHFCGAIGCTNARYKLSCKGKPFFTFPTDEPRTTPPPKTWNTKKRVTFFIVALCAFFILCVSSFNRLAPFVLPTQLSNAQVTHFRIQDVNDSHPDNDKQLTINMLTIVPVITTTNSDDKTRKMLLSTSHPTNKIRTTPFSNSVPANKKKKVPSSNPYQAIKTRKDPPSSPHSATKLKSIPSTNAQPANKTSKAILPNPHKDIKPNRIPTSNSPTTNKTRKISLHNDATLLSASKLYGLPVKMPSIQGTNITRWEIDHNLELCRARSITLNQKGCSPVHSNSTLFWRTTKSSGFSHSQDFARINLATSCCAFNHTELMAPSPSNELFPWERDYLSQGPLLDMKDTAWASTSSVELASSESQKKFIVGGDARFIIRIRNGRSEERGKGGDSVRLWLVNDALGASVTANVKDKGDGTYEAKSKLPWIGKVTVKATIAHTRELFRSTLYVQRLFTTTNWFTGVFKNKIASEATPCSPLPFMPGFQASEVCNLTHLNGDVAWYCGKPVKKQLACSDHVGTIKVRWPSFNPLTQADLELVRLTESKRPFMIPSKIELMVEKSPQFNSSTIPLPSTPCHQRDLTTTFTEPMSTGYFYDKKWRSHSCLLPNVNREFANNCLKNTTFILIGDSNTRAQMDNLHTLTGCVHKIIKTRVKWHAPLRCEVDRLNTSIQLFPQKLPFFGSAGELVTHKMLTSTPLKIDSVPSTGRYVILIHYFLHVIPFHLSVTRTRLLKTRQAITRLMKRNPTSYVIVQSPHSAYDHSKINKHKLNIFLFHMMKSAFAGLGNRVMFLNTMDLTIANVNMDGHPHISYEFMNIYLGHICGRS